MEEVVSGEEPPDLDQAVVRQAVCDVAVGTGHRLGRHEGVDDGLLGRLDRGPEERADPGVVKRLDRAREGPARRPILRGESPVAGGEGDEEVARRVLPCPARARHAQPRALCQPFALVRQQRRVGSEDHDDRAGSGSGSIGCRVLAVGGHELEADLASDRHTIDRQPLALGGARLRVVKRSSQFTVLEVTIAEGRNREVRRMWEAVGARVNRLIRVRYGPILLGRYPRAGQYRELDKTEVQALQRLVAKA